MRVPLDTAAAIGQVSRDTIRQWVYRGHINRYPDGYETLELLLWVEQTRPRDESGRYVPATPGTSRLPNSATGDTLSPSSRRIVA